MTTVQELPAKLLIGGEIIDCKVMGGRTYLIIEQIINNESFCYEIELRRRPSFDIIEYPS